MKNSNTNDVQISQASPTDVQISHFHSNMPYSIHMQIRHAHHANKACPLCKSALPIDMQIRSCFGHCHPILIPMNNNYANWLH